MTEMLEEKLEELGWYYIPRSARLSEEERNRPIHYGKTLYKRTHAGKSTIYVWFSDNGAIHFEGLRKTQITVYEQKMMLKAFEEFIELVYGDCKYHKTEEWRQ